LDRFVLGGALLAGAAFARPALTGSGVIAYLAGAAGLIALNERLRQEFPPAVSLLTSLLIFAGTSVFWSMTRASSPRDAILFGVVAAALAMTRVKAPRHRAAAWLAVAAVPLATAATGAHEWSGAMSRIEDILYSSTRGLLSLTPIAYVGVIGTLFYLRRSRREAIASIATLALCVAASASAPQSTPAPFDHGLTLALPLVGPGLALAIEYLRSRPLVAAIPLVVAALLWNYWLMVQYTVGLLPKDEPVTFAAMVRQQADVHTGSPYAYPFAFPANAYFAWREGLPIDRYELLYREPRAHEWDVVMDRKVDRFLLDGWGGAGSTPSGSVRWTAGRRSTLTFPLAPMSARATVELVTSARVEEPAVNADLSVEINGLEIGRFVATPSPVETTFTLAPGSVGRVLRAGYNRLTIVSHGVHRLNPEDRRPLGPLAARSGEIPFPVAVYRIRITSAS
jgi:hypothetical protein